MSVDVSIQIQCSVCGEELEAEVHINKNYPRDPIITVKPCNSCLEDAKKEGKQLAEENF